MKLRILLMLWLFVVARMSFAQLPDFTDLAEKQGPAVVNISSTQIVKNQRFSQALPFDEDDPAFELFKRFIPRQMPGMPKEHRSQSLGSGFVISADGYIMTNAHVVDGADDVQVKFTDKRELKAKVIGADKRTDIALLKVEATGLPTVKLGNPDQLRVGEWVVAIGAPFGFDNSVTAGIVSAKGRSLPQENLVPFIQTDVAINPGNSGGPLFNMKGEVVGVNSQIYSRSGGYMGVSFSIPIDVAMDVQNQLRSGGRVAHGRIGVAIQEVTKELAETFGLSGPQGALVASVEKGAPAEKAGLAVGDVILKFDGKAITQSSDLPRIVGNSKPGNTVAMQVWRNGAARDLNITIGEMPSEKGENPIRRGGKKADAGQPNKLGLILSEPTAEIRKQIGVDYGLIVEDVRNTNSSIDLRPGDVLLALISKGVKTELKSIDQFNGLLGNIDKSNSLTLLVKRGEVQTFVTIKGAANQ